MDAAHEVDEGWRRRDRPWGPLRSCDLLAGVAAGSAEEGGAARIRLADVPLKTFLTELLIPYDDEEVTRLIVDTHDDAAFGPVSHMCVRYFRGWLLSDHATTAKDCLTYCAFIVARLHFDNVVE